MNELDKGGSNDNSIIQVDIHSGARVVDEMLSDIFVFVLLSWLILISAFFDFGEGSAFTLGVLKLSLTGMFFLGARERIKGDKIWGNTNLCFVFLFGLFGGVTDILGAFGFTLNPIVMAIPNVYLGGLMIICIGALRYNPWTFFVLWVCAAFGVFALGLAGLGVLSSVLTLIGQILLGVVAALGTWALIVTIHGYSDTGKGLSLGKPLFK